MSFDATRAIFNQADINRDGTIDRNEFNRWAAGGASGYETYGSSGYGLGVGGYESSALYGNGVYGAGLAGGVYGGSSVYESSAYGAGLGYGAGVVNQAYDNSALVNSQVAVAAYPTDAQGLYIDSNPAIIRRPAATGVQTYTQNVRVRFLQPPPVPPPGPLIIREVRPPQPPAPAPLRIRQQAPPLPTPPPLVLRERPPQPPPVIASQTVIRRLAALPVPPRSVIIERLPPLPPRPRDVVIERWMPYGPQAKRRTLLQRAPPAQPYPRPRNVIIQYEPAQARVVRQFQRLGVVGANPQAYYQTYGGQLLDSATLVQTARSAGVVEDISPPYAAAAVGYSAATYGQDLGVVGGYGLDAGYVNGASYYESSNGYGGDLGYGLGYDGGYQSGLYESSSYGGLVGGFDAAGAAFRNADVNQDGVMDRAEFSRFFEQGL